MEKLVRFLSSYKASIILLLIYAIGLATATFIEKWLGAQAACAHDMTVKIAAVNYGVHAKTIIII